MKQENKTLRLQNWIVNNIDDWNTICGLGAYPISEQEAMRLMQVLLDNDFEEITLVLIKCHYYAFQERANKSFNIIKDICFEKLKQSGVNLDELSKQ